jgi:hypothetical protein
LQLGHHQGRIVQEDVDPGPPPGFHVIRPDDLAAAGGPLRRSVSRSPPP